MSRGDLDGVTSLFAGDAVYDMSAAGAVEHNWRAFQETWEDYRVKADDYRELDADRVLVLVGLNGRGKASGLEMGQVAANILTLRDGKVTRLVMYWNRDRALADLGLKE